MELAAVASLAALWAAGLTGWRLAAYGWWAAFGLALAFIDLAVQRLPTRLSYAAATGYLILLAINAWREAAWGSAGRAVLGGIVATAVLALSALVSRRMVHWGDVRYAMAIGAAAACVSWIALYAAALLSTLTAAVTGIGLVVAGRRNRSSHLPMGPFLFAGTLLAVLLGGRIAGSL